MAYVCMSQTIHNAQYQVRGRKAYPQWLLISRRILHSQKFPHLKFTAGFPPKLASAVGSAAHVGRSKVQKRNHETEIGQIFHYWQAFAALTEGKQERMCIFLSVALPLRISDVQEARVLCGE